MRNKFYIKRITLQFSLTILAEAGVFAKSVAPDHALEPFTNGNVRFIPVKSDRFRQGYY